MIPVNIGIELVFQFFFHQKLNASFFTIYFLDNIINIRYIAYDDVAICVHGVLQLRAVLTVADGNIIIISHFAKQNI